MKITRQTRRDGTKLFRACITNGLLDESRVRRAVQQLITFKPHGYLATLSFFRRLVQLDIARRSAKVESAQRLPSDIQAEVQKGLTETYGAGLTTSFSENPGLIAGMRIKVGSDVYDGTVEGRLNAIEQSFSA
jgi:F-type H+-transporting ATPase subunit delta